MPVADGKIRLTNAHADYIEITVPVFGYRSRICFPFTLVQLGSSRWDAYDEGVTYDKRSCDCNFILTAAEQKTFADFVKLAGASGGRAQSLVLTMPTGSGFFPFGIDKGDAGPFTVAVELPTFPRMAAEEPLRYFEMGVRFSNTGTWPAYTLPDIVTEGNFVIGSVTDLRYPPSGFDATSGRYGYFATLTESNVPNFVDMGTDQDTYQTRFTFQGKDGSTAALLAYLTGTARAGLFGIYGDSNYYIFGRDKSSSGHFNVRLLQDYLEITHENYNIHKIELSLLWEADL